MLMSHDDVLTHLLLDLMNSDNKFINTNNNMIFPNDQKM